MFKQTWTPLQFATGPAGEGGDALATLLNIILSHLKVDKTFEQLIFTDFFHLLLIAFSHILVKWLQHYHSIL